MSIGDGIGFAALCAAVIAFVLIRRWPELRCSHEWEKLGRMNGYIDATDKMPATVTETFRCPKCGASRKYAL